MEKQDSVRDTDFALSHGEHPYRFSSISEGGSILSSPCLAGDVLVFGCNDTYLYALDSEGNKRWSYKTGGCIFSSPTAYADTVVTGSNDGFLYALSLEGELRWKRDLQKKVFSTPLIVGGTVYVPANNGYLYALSTEDSKELWTYYHATDLCFMGPAAANDRILYGQINGDVVCLSSEGKKLWSVPTGGAAAQTPLVVDASGNEVSSFARRSFSSFPKSKSYRTVIGSADGYVRCLDTENGAAIWAFNAHLMGSSSPAAANGLLFFGSFDGHVYAVDNQGKMKWKFLTGNRIVSSPIVHDGIVYVGSSDHNMYALDAQRGTLLWRFLTDGEVVSSPVTDGKTLFVGSWDGNMYALSLKEQKLLWKFKTRYTTPSFIRKPFTVSAAEREPQLVKANDTATTRGENVGKTQYSPVSGEATNTFYGSSMSYKPKKPYEMDKEPYR